MIGLNLETGLTLQVVSLTGVMINKALIPHKCLVVCKEKSVALLLNRLTS